MHALPKFSTPAVLMGLQKKIIHQNLKKNMRGNSGVSEGGYHEEKIASQLFFFSSFLKRASYYGNT